VSAPAVRLRMAHKLRELSDKATPRTRGLCDDWFDAERQTDYLKAENHIACEVHRLVGAAVGRREYDLMTSATSLTGEVAKSLGAETQASPRRR
jgi:hypothetical protein